MAPSDASDNLINNSTITKQTTTTSGSERLHQQMAQLSDILHQQPSLPLNGSTQQDVGLQRGTTIHSNAPKGHDIHQQGDVRLIIAGYLRENANNELSIISQPIVIQGDQSQSPDRLLARQAPIAALASSSAPAPQLPLPHLPPPSSEPPEFATVSSGISNLIANQASIPTLSLPISASNQAPMSQRAQQPDNIAPAASNRNQPQNQQQRHHWQMMLIAARQGSQVRQRVSMAGDQLGASLRQLYASASSVAADLPPAYHNIPGIVPYYHGRSSGPPPSYDDVVNPYAPPPSYQSLFGQMLEARKRSRGFLDLMRRLLIINTLGCTIFIAFMILVPFTMIIIGAIYLDECKVEHIPAFLLVGGLVWASKNILHCYAQCQPDLDEPHHHHLPHPHHNHNHNHNQQQQQSSSESSSSGDDLSSSMTNNSSGQQTNLMNSTLADTLNHPAANSATMATVTILDQQQETNHNHSHQQATPAARTRRLKSSICESLLKSILLGWFIAGCVIVFRNYEPDFENPSSARYCNRTVYMYTFWLITTAIMMVGLFISCICCLMVSSAIASRQEDDLS